MPDPFRPGLPTQYQRPGGKTSFNDADMKPRSSMNGLYDAAAQAKSEQENFDNFNGGQTNDDILADAQETLAKSYGNDSYASLNRERFSDLASAADAASGREQARTERASHAGPVIKDAVQTGASIGSMVPGPVGMASSAALAGLSGYDALNDLKEGNYGSAAFDTLGMIPAAVHAAHYMKPAAVGRIGAVVQPEGPSKLGATRGAAHGPEYNQGYYPGANPTAPDNFIGAEFDDVAEQVGRGFNPRQEIQNAVSHGRRAPMSDVEGVTENVTRRGFNPRGEIERVRDERASMKGLKDAGSAGEIDLSGDLESLVSQPPSPRQVAQERASERFGKQYRSETGNPSGSARTVPSAKTPTYAGAGDEMPTVTPQGIFDASGRYLAPIAGSADDLAYFAWKQSKDPRR